MVRIFMFVLCVWFCWPIVSVEAVVSASSFASFHWNIDDSVQKSRGSLVSLQTAQRRESQIIRQLAQVENDLSEMRREYYSGRYSRVRPSLLMILGGSGLLIGGGLTVLGLLQVALSSGLSSPSGLLIAGVIVGVGGLVCLIVGGVWLAKINRRRLPLLRLMNNARHKRYKLQRLLRRSPRSRRRISQPTPSRVGLLTLPKTHVSHWKISF